MLIAVLIAVANTAVEPGLQQMNTQRRYKTANIAADICTPYAGLAPSLARLKRKPSRSETSTQTKAVELPSA
ncbi:hypothetical protein PAE0424a [Pyrobaculum aerophilum str. IM2]|uniref:Uncharacterized protein n=1 Tax=Pyrobaculum aerophilum (strain ATCC 51768 / DSM 7523 / JCM 9630 / CIP 104966 / NBRC 100827 / IM2) TaxID=178306 RepID=Q8ZZ59_PYRAE|nr:hypothetical protein PAE0424a [Pyrobaculum aerophilum str. IM2]